MPRRPAAGRTRRGRTAPGETSAGPGGARRTRFPWRRPGLPGGSAQDQARTIDAQGEDVRVGRCAAGQFVQTPARGIQGVGQALRRGGDGGPALGFLKEEGDGGASQPEGQAGGIQPAAGADEPFARGPASSRSAGTSTPFTAEAGGARTGQRGKSQRRLDGHARQRPRQQQQDLPAIVQDAAGDDEVGSVGPGHPGDVAVESIGACGCT